jgi:hypothetical protein
MGYADISSVGVDKASIIEHLSNESIAFPEKLNDVSTFQKSNSGKHFLSAAELVTLCHPVRPDLVYQCIIFAACW